MSAIDLHTYVMKVGRHKGVRLVNVPVNYLLWMINIGHSEGEVASLELKRRGTVVPTIDISGHAIDRASLLLRKVWHQDVKKDDEGLHAWLVRVGQEALERGLRHPNGKIYFKGMKFKFGEGTQWPVLLTVLPAPHGPPRTALQDDPTDEDQERGEISEQEKFELASQEQQRLESEAPEHFGSADPNPLGS